MQKTMNVVLLHEFRQPPVPRQRYLPFAFAELGWDQGKAQCAEDVLLGLDDTYQRHTGVLDTLRR